MSVLKTLTINGTTYNVTPIVPASSVTLLASAWTGEGELHSQVVEIPGVTHRTKVDLQPTAEQLEEFYYKILAFSAENDEGVVTVYAIGDRPLGDHTIQITLTEVEGEGKIRGNTVGTPAPRSDWNQTDPRKADYIANKPDIPKLQEQIEEAEAIAKGRATGYVFDTTEDLDAWLADPVNTANLNLGDNLYIRATDVPDYWWDGEQKQILETQKVDLSEYVKNADYATYSKAGIVQILPESGFVCDEGGKLRIHPASYAGIDNKESLNNPICPATIDYAVRAGLINPKNVNWTEDDKWRARVTLGVEAQGYVKNTDFATAEKPGIVRLASNSGLKILDGSSTTTPSLAINPASLSSISNRANGVAPIVPNTVDYAVRAALTDPKNITWTPEQKAAVRDLLGITEIITGLIVKIEALESMLSAE